MSSARVPQHSPTEAHARSQRRQAALREAGYVLGLLVSAGAAYTLLVLWPNQLRTQRLETQRETLQAEVKGLRSSIARIERDTEALQEDPWAVEEALRRRLGYLQPGEHAFEPTR